jgi:hypothetical protein
LVLEKSFWDIEVSPSLNDSGNFGEQTEFFAESSANLKSQTTFTNQGWDFTTKWEINPLLNNGYPILQWQ